MAARVHVRSGRPSGCPPGPPQIRTCRFPASGSSRHGFAEGVVPSLTLWSVPLSDSVSLTRSSRSMPLSCFPSSSPCPGFFLSSGGSSRVEFPAFSGHMKKLRLLMSRLLRYRSRAPSITSDVLFLGSCRSASSLPIRRLTLPAPRAWSLFQRSLLPLFHVENIRSPKFLGEPCVNMPRSSTPALSNAIGFLRPTAAFRSGYGVGFRATSPISRLNHAACSLAVYTSRNGSPRSRATLASSRAPPFAGQDSDLSALAERFPTLPCYLIVFPLSEASWRTPRRGRGFQ